MAENKDKHSGDAGADQVQQAMDEEQDTGYRGEVPDKTPNENYTVAGVVAKKPTPENQKGK